MKWKWLKIKKYYKGGGSEFQIRYPDIKISGETWDEILEYVGDNTGGGQAYGYDIRTEKLPRKSRKLEVIRYPPFGELEKCGEVVKVVRKSYIEHLI